MTDPADPAGLAVSMLMALLDGEPYLAEALASIGAQTWPPVELLVLDGGSTDGSRERVLAQPGATLVDLPDSSWYDAVNAGLARASGDLIAFASSDDILHPRALERHVEALAAHPGAGYSVGKVMLFADPGGTSGSVPPGLAGSVHRARALEAVVVRRSVVERLGGLRADIGHSSDVEWMARLGDEGVTAALVDEVVVSKRLHRGNTTYTQRAVGTGITRSLRLSILRKQGRT